MFQVGFLEILLIFVISLFIFGPDKLPSAIKSITKFWYLAKSKIEKAKTDFERDIGAEEIEQDVFNELKLKELKKNE